MQLNENFKPGDVAYIIMRNPHAQGVANVQEAQVSESPDDPEQLALFIHETYYPMNDEVAIFKTEQEAEQVYQEAFGTVGDGDELNG